MARTSWRNYRISQNVTTRIVGDRVGGPGYNTLVEDASGVKGGKSLFCLIKSDYLNIN
ncbi:MAG TPA: hypothetical protein VJS91_01130 [Nitrososphaeraceae archaeon]|nr:hypothetical protein [Nitrososphaeraceae archaeon]